MKMTKQNVRVCLIARLAALLLSLLLLASLCILPISAESQDWDLSEDGRTLTHGDEVDYDAYRLPLGYRIRPHSVYAYEKPAFNPNSYYDETVYADEPARAIHWLGYYLTEDTVYLTEDTLEALEDFLGGTPECFYLTDEYDAGESKLEAALVESLDASTATETLDVSRDLYGATRYELLAYDESATLCFTYGAIYEIDKVFYYVNYTELSNEHFDADGNFSYRAGSVEGRRLTDDLEGSLKPHLNDLENADYAPEYSYEEGDYFVPDPNDDSPLFFWSCYVFLGFLLPTVPLVFGLVLPRREKLGKPTYWYAMAIAAGAWIVLALALMVLLL